MTIPADTRFIEVDQPVVDVTVSKVFCIIFIRGKVVCRELLKNCAFSGKNVFCRIDMEEEFGKQYRSQNMFQFHRFISFIYYDS